MCSDGTPVSESECLFVQWVLLLTQTTKTKSPHLSLVSFSLCCMYAYKNHIRIITDADIGHSFPAISYAYVINLCLCTVLVCVLVDVMLMACFGRDSNRQLQSTTVICISVSVHKAIWITVSWFSASCLRRGVATRAQACALQTHRAHHYVCVCVCVCMHVCMYVVLGRSNSGASIRTANTQCTSLGVRICMYV